MLASLSCLVDDLYEINKKLLLIELSEKSPNTYQLCNKDFNKFPLLSRKGFYPYEYMDSWEKFYEESLPNKEYWYSNLNKEDITKEEYEHALKVWKEINIKISVNIMTYMFRVILRYLRMYLKILEINA